MSAVATGIILGTAASIMHPGAPAFDANLCRYDFGNATFDVSFLQTSVWHMVQDSRNNLGSFNYTYIFNFCANLNPIMVNALYPNCSTTYPGSSLTPPNSLPSPAFQIANVPVPSGDKCHRLGGPVGPTTMNYGLVDYNNPTRGAFLQYTGGDQCPGYAGVFRSLKIWLLCYDDVNNIPDEEPVLENYNPPCMYEIFVQSAYGCPIQCPFPASADGTRALCANHGVCDFDGGAGKARCFCNPGWEGDDCSQIATAAGGLSPIGGVLIGVSIFLALSLGGLAYLWFFKIARLRLDMSAYSTLASGEAEAQAHGSGGVAKGGEIQ